MHEHSCEVCDLIFSSPKRQRRTCSFSCRGVLARRAPGTKICACGAPAERAGTRCPKCAIERKRAERRSHYARHRHQIRQDKNTAYRESSEVRAVRRLQSANAAEKARFNGLRHARLKLDKFKCQSCGADKNLVVHHKDRIGRPDRRDPGSALEDLATLCRGCHIRLHMKMGHLSPSKAPHV